MTNWTIEGTQHQKNKNWWIWYKSAFLMNPQDPKYQLKSNAITSAEPNYFVHFAMRHPVLKNWSSAKLSLNQDLSLNKMSLNKMSLNRDCSVLRTSDAWSMRQFSYRPRDQVFYIEDCRIFIENSDLNKSKHFLL